MAIPGQALRLVVTDLAHINADILEYFIQRFAEMTKFTDTFMGFHCGNTCSKKLSKCSMEYQMIMARALSSHLRDREYADTAEGLGCYRQYFALCHISAQDVICGALQTKMQ